VARAGRGVAQPKATAQGVCGIPGTRVFMMRVVDGGGCLMSAREVESYGLYGGSRRTRAEPRVAETGEESPRES